MRAARLLASIVALTAHLAQAAAAPATIALKPGERYFRLDGKQAFLLGRNPTGWKAEQFDPLLRWAADSGERIVRIHLTHGRTPQAPAGQVDKAWAQRCERLFDKAAHQGLHVLPVLGVWAEWNDGSKGEKWHTWHKNPYNAANGGPAAHPTDLLADTECRKLWLRWLGTLVARWHGRPNILGWEIFSELDLITGSSEAAGVAFTERAAAAIRAADPRKRPVTASLAGIHDWPKLSRSKALDFIQIHPYADGRRYRGNLDSLIIDTVRQRLRRYGRPVFIGESGLDSRGLEGTLAEAPRAHVGIRHAIWAALVSGAMNGRMLWWQDGHDLFHDADLGSGRLLLGWFRDTRCEPPHWPSRRLEGQAVALAVPTDAKNWQITFYDTTSARPIAARSAHATAGKLPIALPPFHCSIAFKVEALPPQPR